MKKFLSILLLLTIIASCEKNHPPICEIISPVPGSEFMRGEIITISVDAHDSDGSIKKVRFYIDGIGITSVLSFPYNYEWNTATVDVGSHTIRAVAIDDENLEGEASLELAIIKSSQFTDLRDNNEYEYLTFGTQIWMTENLAYLPSVNDPADGSDNEPYYYVYGYEGSSVAEAKATDNFDTYGVLYNWAAATADNHGNGQDICPDGWHLPSDEEWTILTNYLENNGFGYGGSGSDIGKSMASINDWNSSSSAGDVGNDQGSNNSSGFQAFPGGRRSDGGGFYGLGDYAYFWSSSPYRSSYAWIRGLRYDLVGVYRYNYLRRYGFSVRCLQN